MSEVDIDLRQYLLSKSNNSSCGCARFTGTCEFSDSGAAFDATTSPDVPPLHLTQHLSSRLSTRLLCGQPKPLGPQQGNPAGATLRLGAACVGALFSIFTGTAELGVARLLLAAAPNAEVRVAELGTALLVGLAASSFILVGKPLPCRAWLGPESWAPTVHLSNHGAALGAAFDAAGDGARACKTLDAAEDGTAVVTAFDTAGGGAPVGTQLDVGGGTTASTSLRAADDGTAVVTALDTAGDGAPEGKALDAGNGTSLHAAGDGAPVGTALETAAHAVSDAATDAAVLKLQAQCGMKAAASQSSA